MDDAPVYATKQHPEPDSAFAPGELGHLAVGNRGRLLDARRTPVTVVDVAPERGSFTVRIEAFEDTGARWELGLEEIERFQFARAAPPATDAALAQLQASAARFDRELSINADEGAREDSLLRLQQHRHEATAWLAARTSGLEVDVAKHISSREGHPAFYALLEELLTEYGLHELEHGFTASFVTNPRAGELVKGHSIVLAELGLSDYRGTAPRDDNLFTGSWSRPRRADHLLWRLAFTHALWFSLGWRELTLYRAATTEEGVLQQWRPATLISTTFSREVADAHFEGGRATRVAVLWRQRVPVQRALMTFLETRAMNRRFHEAEAVLLADGSNGAF
jgi:hypothetical protein